MTYTDEEIIKALYTCADEIDSCNRLTKIALDLVKRQREELDRLKKQLDDKCDKCNARDKTEAVKEFAERLKEKSYKTIRNYGLTKDVVEVCDIDNLLKEMESEGDA